MRQVGVESVFTCTRRYGESSRCGTKGLTLKDRRKACRLPRACRRQRTGRASVEQEWRVYAVRAAVRASALLTNCACLWQLQQSRRTLLLCVSAAYEKLTPILCRYGEIPSSSEVPIRITIEPYRQPLPWHPCAHCITHISSYDASQYTFIS